MMDAAVRDASWRSEGLGHEVARYLLYLRNARDASSRTIEDYESILARFTVEHAHLELVDFEGALGAERILEFIGRRWGDKSPGTRRKVLAIFSSFFRWAARMDRIQATRWIASTALVGGARNGTSTATGRWWHSTMHRWFKRCLQTAGAADFPMHELRHTAGDEFRRAGNDLELTRLFMRHASISTTSDFYMHVGQDELVEGMRRSEERWSKG
jgi:site-specific recombinase XerD